MERSGDSLMYLIGVAIGLAVAIAIAFIPFWQGGILYEDDAAYYYLPAFKFYSETVKRGESPDLAPELMSGFPLALSQSGGFRDPLNHVIFRYLEFPFAYHARVFLNYWLAALFTYLFCRTLGLSRFAAVVGAFSFITAQNIVYGANILRSNSFFLMPGLFYAIEQLRKREKLLDRTSLFFVALGSLVVGISLLGGYTQLNLYGLLGAFAYLFARLWRSFSWRFAALSALTFFGGFFIFLPYAWDVLAYLPVTERAGGLSWELAKASGSMSALLKNITLGLVIPPFQPTTLQTIYIGIVGVLGAVFAVLWSRRGMTLFFAGLFLFAVLASFPYPIYWFLHLFPPFRYFRFPPHWLFVASFALSMLAALGYESMKKRIAKEADPTSSQKVKKTAEISWEFVLMLILIFNFVAYAYFTAEKNTVAAASILRKPAIVEAIRRHEPSGNLFRTYAFYPGDAQWFLLARKYDPPQGDFIDFKREVAWPLNSPLAFGIPSVRGQDYFASRRYQKMLDFIKLGEIEQHMNADQTALEIPARLIEVLGMMNVKYLWSNVPVPKAFLGREVTQLDASLFKNYPIPIVLYKNERFLPRAYAPKSIQFLDSTVDNFSRIIEEDGPHFDEVSFLECEGCRERFLNPAVTISVTESAHTNLAFETESAAMAYVVISNELIPGWRATIDGKETKLYPANYIYQGIAVPPGKHKVRLLYEP